MHVSGNSGIHFGNKAKNMKFLPKKSIGFNIMAVCFLFNNFILPHG